MVAPPPRPAPSADGWSSGENQYCAFNPQHSGTICTLNRKHKLDQNSITVCIFQLM